MSLQILLRAEIKISTRKDDLLQAPKEKDIFLHKEKKASLVKLTGCTSPIEFCIAILMSELSQIYLKKQCYQLQSQCL